MMKTIAKLSALTIMSAILFACSLGPGDTTIAHDKEAFFVNASDDYTFSRSDEPRYTITAKRNGNDSAQSIPVRSYGIIAGIDVPAAVEFDAGSHTAGFTVGLDIDKLVPDRTYRLSFVMEAAPYYPTSAFTLDVTLKGELYRPFFDESIIMLEYGPSDDATLNFTLKRGIEGKRDTVRLQLNDITGSGLFSVPASVVFPEGSDTVTFPLIFDRDSPVPLVTYEMKVATYMDDPSQEAEALLFVTRSEV